MLSDKPFVVLRVKFSYARISECPNSKCLSKFHFVVAGIIYIIDAGVKEVWIISPESPVSPELHF